MPKFAATSRSIHDATSSVRVSSRLGSIAELATPPSDEIKRPSSPGCHTRSLFRSVHVWRRCQTGGLGLAVARSEERRVGKEWRSRGALGTAQKSLVQLRAIPA